MSFVRSTWDNEVELLSWWSLRWYESGVQVQWLRTTERVNGGKSASSSTIFHSFNHLAKPLY